MICVTHLSVVVLQSFLPLWRSVVRAAWSALKEPSFGEAQGSLLESIVWM